jgi:hypothetical protein
MQSQEKEFCELNSIKALVMTWNAGATTPYHLQHSDQDASFFRDLLQGSDSPDILVFGFQELVDLEDKKTTASKFVRNFVLHWLIPCRKSFQIQEEGSFRTRAHGPSVSGLAGLPDSSPGRLYASR